jgi:phage terminase large subunit GpA-like protein
MLSSISSSETSSLNSMLIASRQRSLKLLNSIFIDCTVPPKLTIDEWADRFRMLSPESSAEPGRWRTSRTPYMREPMREITNPEVETVVIQSSSQVGKTELCLNVTGFFVHQDPAPILLIEPTLDIAEAYSKDRLAPMIRETPVLSDLIKESRSRDSGNTILHKQFPGGHITLAGSNSPSGLASRPIRILICDEIDRYAPSAGAEGNPVVLASKRTTTFWNRKKLFVSSPTIKDLSAIEACFLASDQRYYRVPCWACKKKAKLEWSHVHWENRDPRTALYVCRNCGAGWEDAQRVEAVMNGEWIAEAEFKGVAGFQLWEAYNP